MVDLFKKTFCCKCYQGLLYIDVCGIVGYICNAYIGISFDMGIVLAFLVVYPVTMCPIMQCDVFLGRCW